MSIQATNHTRTRQHLENRRDNTVEEVNKGNIKHTCTQLGSNALAQPVDQFVKAIMLEAPTELELGTSSIAAAFSQELPFLVLAF